MYLTYNEIKYQILRSILRYTIYLVPISHFYLYVGIYYGTYTTLHMRTLNTVFLYNMSCER